MTNRGIRWLAALAVVLTASLAPAPAGAQLCLNTSIYRDLSDEAASFPTCHDGVLTCQEPELQLVDVALDPPDCEQTWQPCSVTATVDTRFPGNHQNDPSQVGFGYSFGTLVLETLGGGLVDTCGYPGAAIRRDVGQFIHSVGVPCGLAKDNPIAFQLRLKATMCPCPPGVPFCPWQAGCEKEVEEILDFVLPTIECPPKHECCEDCEECLEVGSGAAAVTGAAAGICSDDTGPGARLRYVAGGAGSGNLPGSPAWRPVLGRGWSHDYAERLVRDPDDSRVWLITRFGSFREFRDGNGDGDYEFVSPSDEKRPLKKVAGGWQLEELEGTVHSFDAAGRWLSTLDPDGVGKTATYGAGGLTEVTMPDGRRERFGYHPGGKLATIDEVGIDGTSTRTWSYLWAADDLVEILRPDGTRLRYRYQDPRHPGYVTQSILVGTGGDERVETAWQYDHAGRAVRIWKGDVAPGPTGPVPGPDAIDVRSLSFLEKDSLGLVTETRVTDALGQVSTYKLGRDSVSAKPRLEEISGDCPTCGLGPNSRLFYDDPANPMKPTRVVDGRGTTTLTTYDARGQRTSRTEAMGTALERTTTWEYDATYPTLVAAIERPSTSGSGVRRTTWTRDGEGNATVRTEEGVESGSAFSHQTVSAYNGAGRKTSVDPPGFGTADRTTFTYDPARGNLVQSTRTDPVVGTTTFGYDPWNRRVRLTDPNGVVTETVYDPLNRIERQIQRGATAAEDLVTHNVYDQFGDLSQVVSPEGNVVEYGYDPDGRLISVERKPDAATRGEQQYFTLNAAGQRVREERRRWTPGGWQSESATQYVYSSRCQVDQILHADGSVTELDYDCNGNLEREWDANHPSSNGQNPASGTYAFDLLNRMKSVTRPWGGTGGGTVVTAYEYDVQDHLTRVTDGNGTVTGYTYSDRDLLTEERSEVAGTTTFAYDQHQALVSETDQRGVTVARSYDAYDRLVLVDFPGITEDIDYTYYDPAVPFSRGRLTAVSRGSSRIDYRFDRFGRQTRDGVLSYGYDKNGNLTSIAYPGGVTATYGYDFADRQASLTLQRGADPPQAIVTATSYQPLGPLSGLTLGNGLVEDRRFDDRYRPTSIEVPGRLHWTYAIDAVGNVTAVTDQLAPGSSRSYDYQDYQYFLTGGDGPWGDLGWQYDRSGNRLSETRDGVTTTYTYRPNQAGGSSPQLAAVSSSTPGAEPTIYGYDPRGNPQHSTTGNLKVAYRYDGASRLSQIRRDLAGESSALTDLTYDGRDMLSQSSLSPLPGKPVQQWVTRPTYGSDGRLHHRAIERHATPASLRDTPSVSGEDYVLYFAGRPAAQLSLRTTTPASGPATSTATLLFFTNDHLGTPVLVTDGSGGLVWAGGFEPFGKDFSGALDAGIFLRLPGQWQDETWQESSGVGGLHYNVHRWYGADLGRYHRVDPLRIDRRPEVNPYAFVMNRPLFAVDPLGLVTKREDCKECCSKEEALSEYRESAIYLYRNADKYLIDAFRAGWSCDDSSFQLWQDLEKNVKPKCWVTSQQLVKLLGPVADFTKWLCGTTLTVHYVVKYELCGEEDIGDWFFDGYFGVNYGPLPGERQLDSP